MPCTESRIVTRLIPVLGIGTYEGGYNHGLKDALYFSGATAELMNRLFPAPTYEMPNDSFLRLPECCSSISAIYELRAS